MGGREEEAAAAVDLASSRRQSMRIYIGGVGPTVTSADVDNTFSPLGRVSGVEFVRTNGRNFAYMDFEPHSEKTLARLFSTYNGCSWKGGKLKLERAKEHYLDRLKREWEEDAKVMSEAPADLKIEKVPSNSKLERLKLENMQLQIFFPKLRKVKPLPFKGTGKHKYSFQRIEVPPLPIHFCDCEEHWEPSEKASQKYLSSINSGIHYDKELSIMNSVMNNLFSKENTEHTASKEMMLDTDENASDPYTSDVHEEDSEEILEMDDNIVTNIGVRRTDDMLTLLGGDTQGVDQGARASKHHSSKTELSRSKADVNNWQEPGPVDASETAANKKAHSELATNITENESTVIVPQTYTSSVGYHQEPDILAQPTVNKGPSRSRKSSWKDLVEEAKKTSFSITNVLPGTTSLLPGKPSSGESAADKSTLTKTIKPRIERKKSKTLPVMQDPPLQTKDTQEGQEPGASDAPEVVANQKAHSELPVKNIENEFKRPPLSTNSDGQSPEPDVSAEPSQPESQTVHRMIADQGTKGQSWSQKSSWKDLVGGTGSGSFSITNILPGISALQSTEPNSSEAAADELTEAKEINPQHDTKLSKALPAVQYPSPEKASGSKVSETCPEKQAPPPEKAPGDGIVAHAGGNEHEEPRKAGDQEPRRTRPEASTTRVCTFMRSEESMRQWAQAKAALSRRLHKKRKNTEDDSMQPRKVRQKMR